MFQADDIRQALAGMHKQLSVKPPKDSSERRSVREPKPDPAYDLERQMEHELTRNRMKNLKLRRKNASANSSLNNSANGTPTAGSQNQSPLHSDPGTPGSQGQSPLGSQNQSPLHSDPGTPGSRGQSPLHSEPGTPQNELVNPAPSSPKAKDLTSGRESSVEPSGPSVIVKEFYFDPRLNDEEEEFQMMRKDRLKVKDNGKKKPANTCGLCRRRLSVVQQAVKCQCSKSFCFLHRATSLHNCSVDYKQAGRRKLQKDNPKCEEGGAHKGQFED
ncbi:hypothetical protein L596_025198 [Steinernema carpocapsae]|uniref:AN1-type domain-containing protein n=1 Tax=Steinernema carpocapsae TaxID=34508 RepID=A0A4U5M738_STECR|nr:hypothetical protein L596_025198 [Steinernema carpocapsae]